MAYTDAETEKASAPKGKSRRKRGSIAPVETRVRGMIHDALRYNESDLARFRIKAGKYYRGEKFGDEEQGRSQVVLTEVRDAVLQRLPSLMRVLLGPDGAVEFIARRSDAVDLAAQQTDYINHIFLEDNPGFFILYTTLKDALVRRIGVIKWRWEEKDTIEAERLSGLAPEELQAYLQVNPDVELGSVETGEDGKVAVEVRRKGKRARAVIESVPPEQFIYNRSARSVEEAVFVGHVTEKTKGELVALGYSRAELEKLGANAQIVTSEERDVKRPQRGSTSSELDAASVGENQKYTYVEAYVREDFGEGLEHRKMCFAGADLKLLHTEPAQERPFAVFTPDPEPGEIQGLSESDMTMDLQLINSHIARGILNSLNQTLNPRTIFNPDQVNVKDLMAVEIGALVRTTGDVNSSVREVVHEFVGQAGLGVLEFFRSVKEDRLGTSRAAAGLNADALQSSGANAVQATLDKAQERSELMARIFAEGLKTLFVGLYNLVRRNQDKARVVRMRGEYVEVDPRSWPPQPDVTVKVGLGGGTKGEKLATIAATVEKMESVMQQMGPNNILTDVRRYRNQLAQGLKLLGMDPSQAWREITEEQVKQMEEAAAAQPPQQDPATELAAAQVKNEGLRLEVEKAKIDAELQYKLADLEFRKEVQAQQDDLKRDELEADVILRAKELELKYGGAVDVAAIKAAMDAHRESIKQDTEIAKAAIGASASSEPAEPEPTEPAGEPSDMEMS